MDLRKPISEYTSEDFVEAAAFVRRLPAAQRRLVISKLVAMKNPKSSHASVNPDAWFGFRGYAISAGLCTGK